VTSYPSSNTIPEIFLPYLLNGAILVPSGGQAKDTN